jgi:hypothetical protein
MMAVVVDPAMQAKFDRITQPIELRDASGRRLGYFVPQIVFDPALYASVKSPIDEAELRRRYDEAGGYSLAEILKELER